MNVYPVNLVPGAAEISSNATQPFCDIRNIYHPYMKHRAYFSLSNVTVNIAWASAAEADTVIIADTNADAVTLRDAFSGVVFADNRQALPGINIFEIPGKSVRRLQIQIHGTASGQAYIGYVFAGNKVTLPRFIVGPEWETQIRGGDQRTDYGQAYGELLPTLDKFSAQFARVYKDGKKILDDYAQAVQMSIPHVIDPYPEARDDFPPLYATLSGGGVSAAKRAENDFYWNFNLEWTEAR